MGIKAGFDESSASARMNQYERGKHCPDTKTIERLCEALKVPVAYLYCEDDQLARVILNYPKLSLADKKIILKLMDEAEST
ncbi:MAG: helix-turn-helix domain-containing protein [Pseudomonadales bacterium]|nr:helix-turn-helix domain-containing protein [Pseudomonadales bacterium]